MSETEAGSTVKGPPRSSLRCWSRPIPPLGVAYIVGIAAGAMFPDARLSFLAPCSLAAAVLAYCLCCQRPARLSPLVFMIGLGALSIQPLLTDYLPEGHIVHRIDDRVHTLTGTIVSEPIFRPGRQRFVVDVAPEKSSPGQSAAPFGRVRVTVIGGREVLARGDRIRFDAKLRPFRNFENPGRFDYRRYMALQGVRASAYVKPAAVEMVAQAAPGPVGAARRALSSFISARTDAPASGILCALLIGDRGGVSASVRDMFNRAGVGHILAISGLHVGIVAAVAFFVFRGGFVFFPFLLQRGWTRKAGALFAMGAVIGYGLLAGMSPSTQRAVIMVSTFMLAMVFGRSSDPLNTLAVAAVAILAVDPAALFSISFQLSFAAVATILYGIESADRWAWFRNVNPRPLRRALMFVFVSMLAIAGTLPLTAYYFNRISLVGLAANFLVIPLIGFAVVPLALVSAVVLVLAEAPAAAGFEAAAALLNLAMEGISLFAKIPHAAVRVVTPSLLEIAVYYVLLGALLKLHAGKKARLAIAAALLIGGADVCHWIQHRLWHPELRVTGIDVGQGSASLLELPRGKTMLIDGGGFSDNRIFDVGAQVVAPFLWRKKIATIDTVVLSHPNSDHLNGLIFIVDNFKVKEVWTNGLPADTGAYRQFMAVLEARGVRRPPFERLERSRIVNGTRIDILHPPYDFMAGDAPKNRLPDANDSSIVVRAGLGAVSFLFPGDAMAAAEREMVARNCDRLAATVLAAPHHGSRTSSTPGFLDCVNPEVVVVSSGWSRRRYFPHPTVENRYRERNLAVLCTHRCGAVTVVTDGREYRVQTMVDPEEKRAFETLGILRHSK